MIGLDLILFFVFLAIVGILIYIDRKNVKLQGIVFIRRTEKGKGTINRIAQSHPRFWRFMSVTGVIIAIPVLFIATAFIVMSAVSILSGTAGGGVKFLLPGPVSTPVNAPGVFIVPWWIWVIGITVVIIPHELFHGIMCRLEKIRIKSVGWLLLLVIPGAFVEPDEAQLKKAKRSTKLKVYAAGSFANLIVAGIVVLILILVTSAAFSGSSGVYFNAVNNMPASDLGMSGIIVSIEGHNIASPDDISAVMNNSKPGDIVEIITVDAKIAPGMVFMNFSPSLKAVAVQNGNETVYKVKLASHPEDPNKGYIGVGNLTPAKKFSFGSIDSYITIFLVMVWIYIFSLGIGMVNLLPIKPLDGGLIFEEIVSKFSKRSAYIVKIVSIALILVLLFNIVGPFFI